MCTNERNLKKQRLLTIWTEQFSQQLSLSYKKTEDGFHQWCQDRIIRCRSLPTYWHPLLVETAKDHPTMQEGEVVWKHIGYAGYDN